jgi:hypothetical protein
MRPPIAAASVGFALLVTARVSLSDVIHACVAKSNGRLRIVAMESMCNGRSETPLSWNTGPGSGPFRFVGFTSASVGSSGALNAGMLEWTRACGAEFSGARACRSGEVVFAVDPPQIANPDDAAWVIPDVVGNGLDVSGAGFTASERSGRPFPTAALPHPPARPGP